MISKIQLVNIRSVITNTLTKFKLIKVNHYPLRKGKKTNFVFIHINKTGGTSIANNIKLYSKRHLTVKEVQEQIGLDWFRAFTFTIVRNPYDKVVSQYEYRFRFNHDNIRTQNISFDEWIKFTYKEKRPLFRKAGQKFFSTQKEWLLNKNGKIDIDYIVRFENLIEDYKMVQDIIGVKEKLPHLNKTERKPYKKYYSEESKKIIEDYFRDDFEEFNYEYENF